MHYLILKGGLGNQLFQLSAFYYFREKEGFRNLKLDCRSGFFFDFKYRRNLEIQSLLKKKYSCSFIESIKNSVLLILIKFFPIFKKLMSIKIIDDNNLNDFKIIDRKINKEIIFFNGYFQNSYYVNYSRRFLGPLIKSKLSANHTNLFNSLYDEIKENKNSIALCIRFYEESKNSKSHSNEYGTKTVDSFNEVIKDIESKVENPYFYIFVQKENNFTKDLIFNSPYKFVTHDLGFQGSWQRIKAQSFCKHHIFNNSTFYYWGAELSNNFDSNLEIDSIRYVSNNFIFKEIYKSSWIIF